MKLSTVILLALSITQFIIVIILSNQIDDLEDALILTIELIGRLH